MKAPCREQKEIMIQQFIESVKGIEQNKEAIEHFIEHLESIGIYELCLEYMYSAKGFSFIDWDTCNDKKVIESLFTPTKEQTQWSL